MIHVVFHKDPSVKQALFTLVDRATKPLLVCAAHAAPGVDVRQREPLRTFDAFMGDLVDCVAVVDEGLIEGMWRDPMGDLCTAVLARSEAGLAAAGYLFLRGRRPLRVVKKRTGEPKQDLHELCDVARELFDPQRTPPPRTRPARDNARPSGRRPPSVEIPGIDDPFVILGIPDTATLDEARAAYRALVVKYHPDKVAHLADEFRELAERRTRELNAAFESVERRFGG